MSHEELNFLGDTFIQNLDNVLYYSPETVDATQVQNFQFYSNLNTNFEDYFNNIDANQTTRLPATWDDFIKALIANYQPQPPPADLEDLVTRRFLEQYQLSLGIRTIGGGGLFDDPISTSTGDWRDLALQGVTIEQVNEQFKTLFNHFVQNYVYDSTGKLGPNTSPNQMYNFCVQFLQVLTQTAQMDSSTDDPLDGSIAAYERVYLAYGFSPADFGTKLKEFYDAQVKEHGYFVPSHSFSDWFKEMRDDYKTLTYATSISVTTPTGGEKLLIIDRILRLLIEMIDVLNSVAASQASRLSGFLTEHQRVYTDLMSEVPTYAADDGTRFGGTGDSAEKARNEINQKMASYLETLRSRRSLVQDDAKAMQSNINQTQDAANQQTNIASAILQQLSTILGAIFR